jgi:hypothetical protein
MNRLYPEIQVGRCDKCQVVVGWFVGSFRMLSNGYMPSTMCAYIR